MIKKSFHFVTACKRKLTLKRVRIGNIMLKIKTNEGSNKFSLTKIVYGKRKNKEGFQRFLFTFQ